jgi:hypothetical protein
MLRRQVGHVRRGHRRAGDLTQGPDHDREHQHGKGMGDGEDRETGTYQQVSEGDDGNGGVPLQHQRKRHFCDGDQQRIERNQHPIDRHGEARVADVQRKGGLELEEDECNRGRGGEKHQEPPVVGHRLHRGAPSFLLAGHSAAFRERPYCNHPVDHRSHRVGQKQVEERLFGQESADGRSECEGGIDGEPVEREGRQALARRHQVGQHGRGGGAV